MKKERLTNDRYSIEHHPIIEDCNTTFGKRAWQSTPDTGFYRNSINEVCDPHTNRITYLLRTSCVQRIVFFETENEISRKRKTKL